MRIISICPSNTELLAYLGLTDQIVAVDDFSNWPEKIRNLPKLGPDLTIDIDKLQSYQPDLVLASLCVPGMERNVEELIKRNIPHVVLNPSSIEDIYLNLLLVGDATNNSEKAKEVANTFKNQIDRIRELNKQKKKELIYWEWWPKPIFTPGKKNWLTDISEVIGAVNCFSDEDVSSVQTTWDEVVKRNPDHICMVWVGVKEDKMRKDAITKRPQAYEVTAVQKNNLYILEESLFCRPSPRIVEGMIKLSNLLK